MPFLTINNIELHYEAVGQGEPLVFIHGLGSSLRDWEAQVEAFARDYHVLTLDLRGHGESDKPPGPYTIPLFAMDVAALLQELDMAPAHLVGISMGGMVAFQLAVSKPGMVKSLTVVNSTPALHLDTFRRQLEYAQRRLLAYVFGMRRTGTWLAARLFPHPDQATMREAFIERWAENDKRAYLNAMASCIGWSVEKRLPGLQVPVLVLAADEDYTAVAHKEAYTAAMPQAELVVIDNARHALPAERPDAFNTALRAFLAAR